MASLNLTTPTAAGAAETMAAAGGAGDSFPLIDGITVRITNAHATNPREVTFVAQNPCNQGELHDQVVTVAALTTVAVKVPGGDQFRDSNGRVQITYDTNADVTIAAYPA